ncbi:NTP transferase domain-containing protein [Helcococcus ovis]|uniref:NTP transferase domain-containing protein n=1 Tax=Helcococcus ovis TaxID=72026 RepID=UPI001070520F|nr:NTP transferase domain-containing protein [Helcococcus ovis]TFF67406.1 winged helix-turn-helix transcriptional regulator [Helcococcus ovis]WNZ01528.1 NTP transferase domain-containing protein [Helcococcus ovis]
MNNVKFDILKMLFLNEKLNQKELSEKVGISVGLVNKNLQELKQDRYIDKDNILYHRAEMLLEDNKSENAIILAAGFGIRMVPINMEQPKGLIEINGEKIIERIIKQLQEVGIKDITVVVGFQKEKYEYLIDKFGISLKVNMTYHEKNNMHSLNCVKNKISNTYIVPSDVYFYENPFSKYEGYSWYMISDEKSSSSYIKENRKREIVITKDKKSANQMVGVSFISKNDSTEVKKLLDKYSKKSEYDNCFWEDALIKSGFKFYSKKVKYNEYIEINTYEKLREVDENSKDLESDKIDVISEVFNVDKNDIVNIKTLKKGMTNRSFLFTVKNQKYIMRIPGEGTDKFINRNEEAEVYNLIKEYNLCDDIIYINPDNGYKITKYIENSRVCNYENNEDLNKAMKFLREFHNKKLKVNHEFNLYEKLEYYQSLWIVDKSIYIDYEETKEKIYKLKNFIDENKNEFILCHIDANVDNYLFFKNSDSKEEIRLIDWEYASMQDPLLDIAMFCIYSLLNQKDVDKVIDTYFKGETVEKDRNLIYAYIAVSGLVWSNWCEIKSQLGIEYGEYSIAQYRYAKDYYKILKNKGIVD